MYINSKFHEHIHSIIILFEIESYDSKILTISIWATIRKRTTILSIQILNHDGCIQNGVRTYEGSQLGNKSFQTLSKLLDLELRQPYMRYYSKGLNSQAS